MAFKMKGKSPMMKALVGKQHNLPPELKAKIEASPAKKYASDAQRKAVHASKAESGMKMKSDPASVTNRRNEGDMKGARIEKRRGKAAAKGNTGKAKRLSRKLAKHDATDNRGKQAVRTKTVRDGGRIEF